MNARARRTALVTAVAVLVAALYLISARRLPVGVYNDDAANVLLSRSLRHGGYSFPGGLGAPEEHLPAFPLLLVVPTMLVEPHWNLLRAVPLAFAALGLFLAWRLARRFLSEEAAAAVVLLTALNPVLVGLGGLVLPHLAYLALSLALLDAVGAPDSPRGFALLAAGAGLAPLLRPHGIILIAALALAIWRRSGPKRAAAFAALALIPFAAWTARNHLHAGSSRDYVDTWRMQMSALSGPGALAARTANILSSMFGDAFACVPDAPRPVSAACGLAALALAAAGGRRLLKTAAGPRSMALAAYAAGLVLLHLTWKWIDARYLISFVPLLWIMIAAAAAPLLAKRRALAGGALAALLVLALRIDAGYARRGLEGAAQFQPATMAWIRGNIPPDALLESSKNYTVALLTGRACATQLAYPRAGQWLEQARRDRIDYLHVILPSPSDEFNIADIPAGYQPAFASWLDGQGKSASQVHLDLGEGAIVYKMARTAP